MMKLGAQGISALYLGEQQVKKAYLGQELVFGSAPAPIATYTITAAIDPAGSGTVTGAGQYKEGETVTLTAVVAEGYSFTGWQENGQTVSTSETYTFTAAGDRALVAVFEEAKTSRLPEGYTEVEYIQTISGAKHCFDTGVNASSKLSAVIDFEPLEEVTSGYQYIFHRVYSATTSGTYWSYCWNAAWTKNGVSAFMGRSASGGTMTVVDSDSKPRRITFEMTSVGRTASVNGGAPVDCGGGSTASYTGSVYVHILGSSSTSPTAAVFLPAKLYSCKMENSGGAARDFVPCVNPSGIVGLYDMVKGKFYQSKNNPNTVVAGPAI